MKIYILNKHGDIMTLEEKNQRILKKFKVWLKKKREEEEFKKDFFDTENEEIIQEDKELEDLVVV